MPRLVSLTGLIQVFGQASLTLSYGSPPPPGYPPIFCHFDLTCSYSSDLQLRYKGRDIGYSTHGRIHSWQEPWVYDGRAWDLKSGISAEARHYNSSDEAIQHAVQKLKDKLNSEGLITE